MIITADVIWDYFNHLPERLILNNSSNKSGYERYLKSPPHTGAQFHSTPIIAFFSFRNCQYYYYILFISIYKIAYFLCNCDFFGGDCMFLFGHFWLCSSLFNVVCIFSSICGIIFLSSFSFVFSSLEKNRKTLKRSDYCS